jgi:ribosome-associated toxin RatA of RatAB toxin-antitoxin module
MNLRSWLVLLNNNRVFLKLGLNSDKSSAFLFMEKTKIIISKEHNMNLVMASYVGDKRSFGELTLLRVEIMNTKESKKYENVFIDNPYTLLNSSGNFRNIRIESCSISLNFEYKAGLFRAIDITSLIVTKSKIYCNKFFNLDSTLFYFSYSFNSSSLIWINNSSFYSK